MSKVSCKILKLDEYTKLVGKAPTSSIVDLDSRKARALIKKEVVELSELQREMEGKKEESITVNKSEETIAFLKKADLLNVLVGTVQREAVGEKGPIKTLILLAALSKVKNKYPTSANLCINAESGAGKDFVASATLKLVPERYVFARRRISQKALDYALSQHQGRDWNNYFVYLEDVSPKVMASESVKTLMSANPDKENIVTIVHEGAIKNLVIFGKPTFLMTAAKAKGTDETIRRLPFCYLDESPEQTLAINLMQAKEAANGKKASAEKAPNFYEGLEPCNVLIPFAEVLAKALAKHWIEKSKRCQVIQRSVFPRFLDYVKASACLHQYQRKKDAEGNVLAEAPSDYIYARTALLQTTSNALMIPLSHEEKELIETIQKEFPEGATAKNINLKISRWEERWLRNILDRLVQLGFLDKQKTQAEGSDKSVAAYLPIPDVLEFKMPTWEELNIKNNAIGAIAPITTISANGANGKELHELHGTFGNKKRVETSKKLKPVPEMIESEPLPEGWKPSCPDLPWLKGLKEKKGGVNDD